ncbi:ribosomal protein S18 acetylase RimI-like enzyme [Tumebacillus sp. BK434]|uniref:GNAT family N-acetyltransferase n=1 Tax=Tumebacillus sp. BK434 TaxID=2512169 RepID=UPI00104748B9|nr:GNAT family N-acetyltransferase [Tumebacillus sp. BK434]TCP55378.1 ribosomal protein S18 acetylase RimI-like enzyme [Tumebacillus sp. BK434]
MLIIRPSAAEDAVQLIAVDNSAWTVDSAVSDNSWTSPEEFLKRCPPGSQIVAELDGVVCGYVQSRNPTGLPSNDHVTELSIAVHPGYHGQGIGRRLLQAIEEQARAAGKRKVALRVLASNPGAIEFYKRCGYVEQGRLVQEFFLGGRYVDDLLMYKLM